MRTITTSRKTYEVDFAWAPNSDGSCTIQMTDDRRVPVIAAEFDGLESIHYHDGPAEQEYDWTGYTRLVTVLTLHGNVVQIRLKKEESS